MSVCRLRKPGQELGKPSGSCCTAMVLGNFVFVLASCFDECVCVAYGTVQT